MRNLGEHLAIGCDDQFCITVTNPAHAKRFSAPNEHHLVGIANDVVVADVPDEETAVRQADLKVAAEPFRSLSRTQALAGEILDEPD